MGYAQNSGAVVSDAPGGAYLQTAGTNASFQNSVAESMASAQALLSAFNTLYLGAFPIDPSVDNTGAALVVGALYFNTLQAKLLTWNGSSWVDPMTIAPADLGYGHTHYNNVTTNWLIDTGKNAVSAGPMTVESGVVVTVASGSVWAVV